MILVSMSNVKIPEKIRNVRQYKIVRNILFYGNIGAIMLKLEIAYIKFVYTLHCVNGKRSIQLTKINAFLNSMHKKHETRTFLSFPWNQR